jgi:hypothetical protein
MPMSYFQEINITHDRRHDTESRNEQVNDHKHDSYRQCIEVDHGYFLLKATEQQPVNSSSCRITKSLNNNIYTYLQEKELAKSTMQNGWRNKIVFTCFANIRQDAFKESDIRNEGK